MQFRILASFLMLITFGSAFAAEIPPKTFPPPPQTTWKPEGCRTVPAVNKILPSPIAFRNLHADEVNTSEVSIALAPVFREDWTAESDTWNPAGVVFDNAGHLYFSPLLPHEDVVLISLNPKDGSRRFAISNRTGVMAGACAPMILNHPDDCALDKSREIVYLSLYDRAFAMTTTGRMIWDVDTGLTSTGEMQFSFGMNYAPDVDAVVGLLSDGNIYALDRRTGRSILNAIYQLPGEKSPAGSTGLPPAVGQCLAQDLARFMDMTRVTFTQIINTLRGNGVEVANFFSIDAHTGAMWIAATAPDAEDGVVDGVSSLGALYKLKFVRNGHKYDIVETCHASFEGGSASTPALRKDGTRAYLGDNAGRVIAIDTTDCSRIWDLNVGSQVTGAIGVSSDNNELYVATRPNILKVIDEGDHGTLVWRSDNDAFELPEGLVSVNQNLATIGANGIAVQIGAGFPPGYPVSLGIGQLDRETGKLRWFAAGGEQTVAEMSTGPDGAVYDPNSGLRKGITNCLAENGLLPFGDDPQIGGITKFLPQRLDLLARDAVCAGADRAANAGAYAMECPASAAADVAQILTLIRQGRRSASQAEADGDLCVLKAGILKKKLDLAALILEHHGIEGLKPAKYLLNMACTLLNEDQAATPCE